MAGNVAFATAHAFWKKTCNNRQVDRTASNEDRTRSTPDEITL